MMVGTAVRTVTAAARVAAGVISHAAWWLDYRVHGRSSR
jgi:hypothetical protein